MESRVASPRYSSTSGWVTEHWYWSHDITKKNTMKGAKHSRTITLHKENQSTSLQEPPGQRSEVRGQRLKVSGQRDKGEERLGWEEEVEETLFFFCLISSGF